MKQKLLGFFTCLVAVFMAYTLLSLAHAAPPEDKGKDKDKQEQGQGNGKGQGQDNGRGRSEEARAESPARGQSEEGRTQASSAAAEARVDRQHPHQERQAREHVDRGTGAQDDRRADRAGDHRRDSTDHGREAARQRVASLTDSLNKLEHARWSHNPHDTRGQGNMGKVDMRDPFGFDKDSGREGAERGRPIRGASEEPTDTTVLSSTLNLAELVSLDVTDPYLAWLQETLDWWTAYLNSLNPSDPWYAWVSQWASWAMTWLQQQITMYTEPDYYRVGAWGDVDYTLNVQPFEGMEGTTLLVSTQLVSTQNVTTGMWVWNERTDDWEWTTVSYQAGDVVIEQAQEITLTGSGTTALNLDLSWELAQGFYDVVITVTEPLTGATYTMTSDKQLYVYYDPYGIVYDKATGKPIVGATVTVHNADGSIVALDKAANPNVSNPQTTDATGRYSCKLAVGKYYLTVKAPGYAEYRSPLFSEGGHIVREDVGMTRAKSETTSSQAPTLPTSTPVGSGIPTMSPAVLPVK